VAYLGNDLQVAFPTYRNIDDISGSFNGVTTSFPLTVDGVAPIPAPVNSQQCLISVNGVVQRPDDSGAEGFLLSGGNIVFASAPAGGVDFFGVILAGADYINIGANFPSGTALVPSITFDSDLDTGIYNPAGNQIGFTTAGVQRLVINSSGQVSGGLGSATTPAFSFLSDPNTGIYSPGADQVAVATNGTGRLFVDASGQVGVGTSVPTSTVHIQHPLQTNAYWEGKGLLIHEDATANQGIALYSRGGDEQYIASLVDSPNSYLIIGTRKSSSTNGVDAITVRGDGKVGINIAAPSDTLHVAGDMRVGTGAGGGNTIHFSRSGQTDAARIACDSSSRLAFYTNAAERARIDENGRLGIGTSSPSSLLHLGGTAAPNVRLESSSGPYSLISSNTVGSLVFEADAGNTGASSNMSFLVDGTSAIRIDSSGRVGIGTTSPSSTLHLSAAQAEVKIQSTSGTNPGYLSFIPGGVSNPWYIYANSSRNLIFEDFATERMRIDSSGRLLVGTSSTSKDFSAVFQGNSADATGGANLLLARGTSSPADGSAIGYLSFTDSNHNTTAQIQAQRDGGTWTSGTSQPGRLVFSTTADGASTPTERLRITSAGLVGIGTTAPNGLLTLQADSGRLLALRNSTTGTGSSDGSYVGLSGSDLQISNGESANTIFYTSDTERARIDSSGRLLVGTSSAYGSARIQARTTGSAATDGSLTLVTVAAAGGDAPNAPYAVTRAVYGSACNSGATETIRTLASREIAFIKIFYSWPAGTPEWKTGAYDYNGSTVSTNWFHESNAGHAFTLGVSGGVLTLTQSVGVTMNMVIEIEYIDSSGLD
jgi:hypothetical protein